MQLGESAIEMGEVEWEMKMIVERCIANTIVGSLKLNMSSNEVDHEVWKLITQDIIDPFTHVCIHLLSHLPSKTHHWSTHAHTHYVFTYAYTHPFNPAFTFTIKMQVCFATTQSCTQDAHTLPAAFTIQIYVWVIARSWWRSSHISTSNQPS